MKYKLDSVHRELFEYWRLRSGARAMPSHEDLRPEDVPGILKHVGLIDVVHRPDALRFRYRLVGIRMNFILGQDLTGTWLHESEHGPYRDFLHRLHADAANDRKPVYSETAFDYAGGRNLNVRRLILPLSSGPDAVDMLLFSNTFASSDHDFGFRPYHATEIEAFDELVRDAA